jgi:hypothetical protein
MAEKFNDSEMIIDNLSEIDSYNPAKWPGQWSAEAVRLYMITKGIDYEQALLDSAEGGKGDAFRHVFSSALMTVYFPIS